MAKVTIEIDLPALPGPDRAFNMSSASPEEKKMFLRLISAAAPGILEHAGTPVFPQMVDRWLYATLAGCSLNGFA